MRRSTGVLMMLVASALLAAGVARAITYGEPDGTAHPYVGLVALYNDDVYTSFRCSGVLIVSVFVPISTVGVVTVCESTPQRTLEVALAIRRDLGIGTPGESV